MLQANEITGRLHRRLLAESRRFTVEDVRVGGSYIAVVLSGARVGLAARLKEAVGMEIEPRRSPGFSSGQRAEALLTHLVSGSGAVERALGLATVNALIHPMAPTREEDTMDLISLQPGERVAMVGLFRPIVPRIEAKGVHLSVIERDTPEKERKQALGTCDVAIITATTLLNGTLEGILNELGGPRHVALIGPSTPLCEPVFQETPVSHLGGSAIVDTEGVLRVIAGGGGTPDMRPFLRFVNVMVHRS
ncbi:MAG TPA: DUF364 domain-containing protein [Syntrophales bacterium]|nr:DUF364 domain-containing protein [Syntrophales bacterium]